MCVNKYKQINKIKKTNKKVLWYYHVSSWKTLKYNINTIYHVNKKKRRMFYFMFKC